MNDRHQTELDARGRAAAQSLHDAAHSRPVPPFHPDTATAPIPTPTSRHPQRRRHLLAAAAAIAVLGAGAAAVVVAGRADDGPAAPVTTAEVPAYVTTEIPDGLELGGVAEGGLPDASNPWSSLSIYGPSPDDPQVGVARVEGWTNEVMTTGPDDEAIPEDDWVVDLSGSGLARSAVAIDDPSGSEAAILALSPTLDSDRLTELARAASMVDGRPQVDEAALPDGWRRVGEIDGGPYGSSPYGGTATGTPRNRSAIYRAPSPTEPDEGGAAGGGYLEVVALPETGDELLVQRLVSDEVSETAVRGHPALVTTSPRIDGADQATKVTWIERPGVVVQVTGVGVDRDAVVAAAEAVEPLDEAAWADLLEQTQLGLIGDVGGDSTLLDRGSLPDGTGWALHRDEQGGLQLRVTEDGAAEGSSSSREASSAGSADLAPLLASTSTDSGGRRFVAGLVDPAVATVQFRHDGEVVEEVAPTRLALSPADADAVGPAVAESARFVLELDAGIDELVLRDADGEALATHAIDPATGYLDPDSPDPGD